MSASPKIAIVGAGPAGLMCARILTQAGIKVHVFEREKDRNARAQGGSLDLHPPTGQKAMQRAGLMDKFEKLARYDDEDTVIADKNGTRFLEIRGEETGRPEIDRHVLRDMLLDSVPENMIQWNCNLRSAEVGKLHFEHGTEQGFDLIIGADGSHSKIRPLLTPVPAFYSGITWIELTIADVDKRAPEVAKSVGKGTHYVWGEEQGSACVGQRVGDGSIHINVMLRRPESWLQEHSADLQDPASLRKFLLNELDDFAPEYKNWVESTDDAILARPLNMLPVGLNWPHKPGVTALGDAAHLMTPFAGEGANIALADAMTLAEKIIENQTDLTKAVIDYENWMFSIAAEKTAQTWENLLRVYNKGGARDMVDMVTGEVEKQQNAVSSAQPQAA